MTKSKIIAAFAAITTAVVAGSGQAQAHPYHFHHHGFGIGLAASTLFGAALASNIYAQPVCSGDCYKVVRYHRWGYKHLVRFATITEHKLPLMSAAAPSPPLRLSNRPARLSPSGRFVVLTEPFRKIRLQTPPACLGPIYLH